MFKKALISVSDKRGLVEFLRPLVKQGLKILSTGGTAQYLRGAGFEVEEVSDYTGHPEVLGGRVKTLHPKIHMAILARKDQALDQKQLQEAGVEPIDLVIGNLYPFGETEEKYFEGKVSLEELIENIDIGGPSFLRASAKNYSSVTVLCDPDDYNRLEAPVSLEERRRLAIKVFAHTARYDSLIAFTFGGAFQKESSIGGQEVFPLRYGENPHQKAAWYAEFKHRGLHTAEVLQGMPLSYNNILDLDAAVKLCCELSGQLKKKSVVAIKHNNPCGASIGSESLAEITKKALQSDSVSVFGGVIACSEKIDESSAKILSEVFLECIIAPDFSEEALNIFSAKKKLRILKYPQLLTFTRRPEVRAVSGGFLVQETDHQFSNLAEWVWPTQLPFEKCPPEVLLDLQMAEIICASLKSNAIAVIKDQQVIGLGMGQVNRVDAVKLALDRAKMLHPERKDLVMASDAFFPFADSIELAAGGQVRLLLQPGGSVRDQEVKAMALKHNIPMILTGIRHFKH